MYQTTGNPFISSPYNGTGYNSPPIIDKLSIANINIVTCNMFIQLIRSLDNNINLEFFESLLHTQEPDEIKVAIEGLKTTYNQVLLNKIKSGL